MRQIFRLTHYIGVVIVILVILTTRSISGGRPERGIGILLEFNEDLVNNAIVEGLFMTNIYRCMHNVPPVELDPRLIAIALDKSDMLVIEGRFGHFGGFNVGGENVLEAGGEYTASTNTKGTSFNTFEYLADKVRSAVTSFYSEEENYDYKTASNKVGKEDKATGHFTAVVWKDTKYIGLGISCGRRFDFDNEPGEQGYLTKCTTVGKYYPPGNVQSKEEYLSNVLPPIKTKKQCEEELFRMK